MQKWYIYGLYKKENFEYSEKPSLDEGLYYIGITTNLRVRANAHRNKPNNPIKKNYIAKYDFDIRVIWECNSEEEALARETFLIKWFKKIDDGGILTNIFIEPSDIAKANLGKKFDIKHKTNMSKSSIERSKRKEYKANQRDAHLSRSYDEIMDILQEWEDSNPLDKKEICQKYNLKRNVFNWWIRKYRPDLRNLTDRVKIKHVEKMKKLGLSQEEYGKLINVNQSTISNWVILNRKKGFFKIKKNVKDLEYKKQKYKEWLDSGLGMREFCRQNNINYNSFKAWKKYYEEY